MFHIENGIKLTRGGLALDFRRRQARAFISHAHFDHMARHELALCTPVTARLYEHRLGRRPVIELPLQVVNPAATRYCPLVLIDAASGVRRATDRLPVADQVPVAGS